MPDTSNSHKAICWSVCWNFLSSGFIFVLSKTSSKTTSHTQTFLTKRFKLLKHRPGSQSHLSNYQKAPIQTKLLVWVFEATTMLDRLSLSLLRWSCARGSASSGWRGCSWLAGLIESRFLLNFSLPTNNPQDQHVLISNQPFNVEKLCRRCVEAQKHEDEVASSRSWTLLRRLWLWPGWWWWQLLLLWWVSLFVSVNKKQQIIQFYYISAAVDDFSIFECYWLRKPLLQEIPATA